MSVDTDIKDLSKALEAEKLEIAKMGLRLDLIETSYLELKDKIDQLDGKLDGWFGKIMQKISVENKEAALSAQKIEMIETILTCVRVNNEKLSAEVNKIKLSIAKIMGFGAAGGGLIAGFIEIFKLLGN